MQGHLRIWRDVDQGVLGRDRDERKQGAQERTKMMENAMTIAKLTAADALIAINPINDLEELFEKR